MSDYQYDAQCEMWDAIAGVRDPADTRKRLFVGSRMMNGVSVTVSRIHGTRDYVVAVEGSELPGVYGWTVDAWNAGRAAAAYTGDVS